MSLVFEQLWRSTGSSHLDILPLLVAPHGVLRVAARHRLSAERDGLARCGVVDRDEATTVAAPVGFRGARVVIQGAPCWKP